MKTEKSVEDGKLTNEEVGLLQRRLDGIKLRINQGDMSFDYVKNGLQLIAEKKILGDFKITTIPFDPVFIGEGWKAEKQEKDFVSEEVDFTRAGYVSCLKEGETSIKGEEHLRRLKESGCKPYGANLFLALWRDWETKKKDCLLERAYQAEIIGDYIDFPDDIFLSPVGGRHCVLCLFRCDDGEWHWGAFWLEGGWLALHVSVVSP
ncbi:hypothetical protein KKA24_01035 [Patescibacteria group bacterium]|nr:hypothetical protein [Patescibacteria group bacterium]